MESLYKKAEKVPWLIKPPCTKCGIRFTDEVLAEWPEKTHICCWWCTYPFETKPIPLPIRYDTIRDVFYIRGTFCSWSCAKAYALNNKSTPIDMMNIFLLRKRVEKVWTTIPCAPCRESLQRFGGSRTIEEFRTTSTSLIHHTLPTNMVLQSERFTETEQDTSKFKDKRINFENIETATETLRLRRPVTKQVKNTLEATMGITARGRVA